MNKKFVVVYGGTTKALTLGYMDYVANFLYKSGIVIKRDYHLCILFTPHVYIRFVSSSTNLKGLHCDEAIGFDSDMYQYLVRDKRPMCELSIIDYVLQIEKGNKIMKKLFISIPMKGRTEENVKKSIEKMHKIAEVIFGEELEIINCPWLNKPTEESLDIDVKYGDVWWLGESIGMLSQADYFISPDWCGGRKGLWRTCWFEREIAEGYGIRTVCVNLDDVAPDCREILDENCRKIRAEREIF